MFSLFFHIHCYYCTDDNNCATIHIKRYLQRSLHSSASILLQPVHLRLTTLRMSYQPAHLNYETSVIRRVRRGDVQGGGGKGYELIDI